jgi:hypothetical protein
MSNWEPAKWQQLLSIYAEQADVLAALLCPHARTYTVDDVLRFRPQFLLTPGLNYRAVFYPDNARRGHYGSVPVAATFQAAKLSRNRPRS